MFLNVLLYIFSFIAIWLGAGLIISSIDGFSKKLKVSSFAVSFIILGLLTSTPEFAVGLTAVANHNAQIFVGNLLGGIPVIFLFIIPVLAIFGNGINLKHDLDNKRMLATLGVILAPALFIIDKRVTNLEGAVLIALYILLLVFIQKKHGLLDEKNSHLLDAKAYSYKDLVKVLLGIGFVLVASTTIVDKTLYFAHYFHVPVFYISLIILSLGTNLPELSLAIRSVISGKKDIAFGDYMGSAAANTLLFGIFTLLHEGEVVTVTNFVAVFLFMTVGLVLFYIFSLSKNNISRVEGFILFIVYCVFVIFELFK